MCYQKEKETKTKKSATNPDTTPVEPATKSCTDDTTDIQDLTAICEEITRETEEKINNPEITEESEKETTAKSKRRKKIIVTTTLVTIAGLTVGTYVLYKKFNKYF